MLEIYKKNEIRVQFPISKAKVEEICQLTILDEPKETDILVRHNLILLPLFKTGGHNNNGGKIYKTYEFNKACLSEL